MPNSDLHHENEINEAYNNMLDMADRIASKGITEESVKEFEKLDSVVKQLTLEEFDKNSIPETTTTSNMTENDPPLVVNPIKDDSDTVFATGLTTEPIEGQESFPEVTGEKVMVSYNPETGEQMVVDGAEDIATKIAERQLASMLSGKGSVSSDIVKELLKSDEFSGNDDASKLASCMARRMAGENFNYYEAIPDTMKKQVDQIIVDLYKDGNVPKNAPALNRKYVAKLLLDDCIAEYKKDAGSGMDLDTILSGFEDDVRKMEEEMSAELGGMMLSFDDERKMEIDAAIKRCEETGNLAAVEQLNIIKETISSAYDITDLIEFCKTCKIKNAEFANPARVYDYFNFKYENHKNVINDIRTCPTILARHLTEYSDKELQALCMAFCKYCQNMSPDNMKDHTFMYYFIRNIIAIDRLNPKGNIYESMNEKSKQFYDGFTANLKLALNNVIERNKDRM